MYEARGNHKEFFVPSGVFLPLGMDVLYFAGRRHTDAWNGDMSRPKLPRKRLLQNDTRILPFSYVPVARLDFPYDRSQGRCGFLTEQNQFSRRFRASFFFGTASMMA